MVALAATRRYRREALPWRKRRCTLPPPLQAPDILLLDEPTTTSMPPGRWLEHHCSAYPGGDCRQSTTATTYNVAGRILELERGHGISWKGNFSSCLNKANPPANRGKRAKPNVRKPWSASSSGSGWRPGAPSKAKARITAYETFCERPREAGQEHEIYIPPGPRLEKCDRGGRVAKLRRAAPDREHDLLCRPAVFSASSAQRRRKTTPVPDDHREEQPNPDHQDGRDGELA